MNQSGIVVSIDFELDWGYNNPNDPLTKEQVSEGLNSLIQLFNKYEIKTTWATVGRLFDGDTKEDDTQRQNNWIKKNLLDSPLVEIGSHTYSHIFCEEVSKETFEDDIIEVSKVSKDLSIEFKSIVFPRNQFREDNLRTLKRYEYTHFRNVLDKWYLKTNKYSNESVLKRFVLRLFELFPLKRDVIIKDSNGITSISDSRFFRFFSSSFLERVISFFYYRILKYEMKKTFDRGGLYHVWFHPHNFIKSQLAFSQLDSFLQYYNQLKKYNKNIKSFKFKELNIK